MEPFIFLPKKGAGLSNIRRNGISCPDEIRKKITGVFLTETMAEQVRKDLDDGAFKVILEARESGKSVTIFTDQGDIKTEKLTQLLMMVPDPNKIIWEAPLKTQQIEFITLLGSDVNLGNIQGSDVISLESLRRGLRSDTFRLYLAKNRPR